MTTANLDTQLLPVVHRNVLMPNWKRKKSRSLERMVYKQKIFWAVMTFFTPCFRFDSKTSTML